MPLFNGVQAIGVQVIGILTRAFTSHARFNGAPIQYSLYLFRLESQAALFAQVAFCLYNGFCIAGCGVGVAAPGCPTRVPGSWVLGGDVQQVVAL